MMNPESLLLIKPVRGIVLPKHDGLAFLMKHKPSTRYEMQSIAQLLGHNDPASLIDLCNAIHLYHSTISKWGLLKVPLRLFRVHKCQGTTHDIKIFACI